MLTCTICGVARSESDYYGSCRATCKDCYRARARAYRAANLERIKDYDRNRPNRATRNELNKENYRLSMGDEEKKRKDRERKNKWRRRNAEKQQAHSMTNYAIATGKLVPQACASCGFAFAVEAHHEDYSKPLSITWLCKPCHGERHREINAERRRAA